MDKYQEMKTIRDEVVSCKKCILHQGRTLPVVGEGSHEAHIMFVGEGPGANENRTGKPFCGRSGDILDELIKHIGLVRADTYVANITKCRPPKNRDPKTEEIRSCTPYLERQIKAINPKVICSLGRHAMSYLMEKYGLKDSITTISQMHGQEFVNEDGVVIIPLYHPAVAVYNSNKIGELKKDFEALKKYI